MVEVLVASTIGSFIALVAVGSLRVIIGGSEAVEDNINSAAEVRFAANMIAKDLINFYRDEDYSNTRFIGTVEDLDDGTSTSYIVFYTLGRTKARVDQPEGDIYEDESDPRIHKIDVFHHKVNGDECGERREHPPYETEKEEPLLPPKIPLGESVGAQ